MKLTLEHSGHTFTIEREDDGQDLEEMCTLIKQLLLGSGYVFDGEVVIINEENND